MMIDTYRILNKEYRPTNQDIGIYGSILDFNGDGKITIEDFENLAVKYLVKPDTRYVWIYVEITPRKWEKDWKWQ